MAASVSYEMARRGWRVLSDNVEVHFVTDTAINAHRGDLGGLFMLIAESLRNSPHRLTERQASQVYAALNAETRRFPMSLALHRRGERTDVPHYADSGRDMADDVGSAPRSRVAHVASPIVLQEPPPRSRRVVRPGDA